MKSAVGNLHEYFVFDRRTRLLASNFGKLLPNGASVLDVGCGDGTIDALIMQNRPDVLIRGLDVLVRPTTKIPVDKFDGNTLPFADKSFDVVMFVDVLHHTDNQIKLLSEAKRVARKLILLKDHTMNGILAHSTLRLMDWVGNAHHSVALPYNYWPEQRWREALSQLRIPIKRRDSYLNLYPFPASLVFQRHLHFLAALGAE